MSRRRFVIICVSFFGALTLAVGGFAFYMYLAMGISDRGSTRLATEWRAKLRAFPSYEQAKQHDPEIQGRQFRNGEWVFGYARDSHDLWHRGGGTLVVRDSRGNMRVFFGHVCGPEPYFFSNPQTRNLDEFYGDLRMWGFIEQQIS